MDTFPPLGDEAAARAMVERDKNSYPQSVRLHLADLCFEPGCGGAHRIRDCPHRRFAAEMRRMAEEESDKAFREIQAAMHASIKAELEKDRAKRRAARAKRLPVLKAIERERARKRARLYLFAWDDQCGVTLRRSDPLSMEHTFNRIHKGKEDVTVGADDILRILWGRGEAQRLAGSHVGEHGE